MPNAADLKKLAIKHLHRKDVQEIKKTSVQQVCKRKRKESLHDSIR